MKLTLMWSAVALAACLGCNEYDTEDKQSEIQAQSLEQAHQQIGMPSVGNFSEKRLMKDLYELRDKEVPTHTYMVNEYNGCLVYLGTSIGYGLPYATQYTSPTRMSWKGGNRGWVQQPQAEPNGLFMPSSAEGTWVQLKGPDGDVKPVYIEPRVLVSPFRLPDAECQKPAPATATVAAKK